jgi:hypothetical protein
MALGENIGYSAWLTQNNSSLYTANYGDRFVHIALMGDGSLRTDYIKPVSNMVISAAPLSGATLTWTASPDAAVIGYYVYRADSLYGHYTLLPGMWTTPVYHDVSGTNGKKYYLVRPVKLQQTPSGNYYNEGIGVADSATVSYPTSVAGVPGSTAISVYPNPAGNKLFLNTGNEKLQPEAIYMTDISGKSVTIARIQETQNIYSFDVKYLPPGIYILHINTGFFVKWIKAN